MPSQNPAKSLAGRVGGLVVQARYGPDTIAARARAGFDQRFELEVDPDGLLAPAERARRAGLAKRAYFARLAMKSAQARRQRSGAGGAQ
ncbi:MAG: hypothetical protein ACKVT1_05445 [Dehalococcoidia bacterium]